ncbi:MAG: hypothetical protein EOP05_01145 [Proteobacteria bacterium]|nr:MAG: hypothetical protein EOP05_01145 [Pseudomonadota bacterium]
MKHLILVLSLFVGADAMADRGGDVGSMSTSSSQLTTVGSEPRIMRSIPAGSEILLSSDLLLPANTGLLTLGSPKCFVTFSKEKFDRVLVSGTVIKTSEVKWSTYPYGAELAVKIVGQTETGMAVDFTCTVSKPPEPSVKKLEKALKLINATLTLASAVKS